MDQLDSLDETFCLQGCPGLYYGAVTFANMDRRGLAQTLEIPVSVYGRYAPVTVGISSSFSLKLECSRPHRALGAAL